MSEYFKRVNIAWYSNENVHETSRFANLQNDVKSDLVNRSGGEQYVNSYTSLQTELSLTWDDVTWLKRYVSYH